ncbi:hypothetical protein [Synechococcus phage S-H35]|uniref:Uncharacterized protein n=1 Tax=Synechococcus phage S-H35 TaxID=1983572 RepID=A0A1Z1LW74_9CAUD|nr:hypothetical protein KNT63_gp034 [Synechococcus phage S-H35]ARW56915.1 hypothetical protein [Synechococcus phage S-H35]
MAPTTTLGNIYRQLIPVALNEMTSILNQMLSVIDKDLDGMGGTVDKTKFLSHVQPIAFKRAADSLGIDYQFVNADGYDTIINTTEDGAEIRFTIEDKMSLMESTDSFATGNNHSKVKDYIHFVMKLQNVGNIFTSCFAALIDVPALSEGSGWDDTVTKKGKNNNGFSSLKILTQDYDKIEVIYGGIRNAKKYIHSEYETLDA